jgi:hypothetical protein
MLRGHRDESAALEGLLQRIPVGQRSVLALRGKAGKARPSCWSPSPRRRLDAASNAPSASTPPWSLRSRSASTVRADARRDLDAADAPARRTGGGVRTAGRSSPDRFLVALAPLSLLTEAAETRPLVA